MLSLSLLFIIITCVDIICQDAMGKSLTENQIKFKKELEKKSAKDSGKTRLILHAKLVHSVCLGYWQCQRPLLRRTRLEAEPKNLHKSKGVLDTGNAKALSKDDIHERGDSANGDAKKS